MHRPNMRGTAAVTAMAMIALGGVAATDTAGPSIPGLWLYLAPAHPAHVSAQSTGVPDEQWGDA